MPKLRDQPCPNTACGWRYEGFHICLNQSKVLMTRIEDGREYRDQTSMRERDLPSASVTRRQLNEERKASKADRDAKIIKFYIEDEMSMKEVAGAVGCATATVQLTLHKAQDRGDLTIRNAGRQSVKV